MDKDLKDEYSEVYTNAFQKDVDKYALLVRIFKPGQIGIPMLIFPFLMNLNIWIIIAILFVVILLMRLLYVEMNFRYMTYDYIVNNKEWGMDVIEESHDRKKADLGNAQMK